MQLYYIAVIILHTVTADNQENVPGFSKNSDRPPLDSGPVDDPGGGYVYRDTRPSLQGFKIEWDPNGYLFFCLAMGRVGNQMEHLLGSLAFAKAINRTLVLPPFRTYRNVRFTEWFKFDNLLEYHRMILAEDFMDHLAPSHWPPGKRTGYCVKVSGGQEYECTLKEGYPFKPFWDGLNVDFDEYDFLEYSFHEPAKFAKRYPGKVYPVLALRGAPASYPMNPDNWPLQRYLVFSDRIETEAQAYINEKFPGEKYVGLHLRNGMDWHNACKSLKHMTNYMASPQCLHGTTDVVRPNMCFPPKEEVLELTRNIVMYTKATVIFVATDKDPMLKELEEHLKDLEVRVYHLDPHLPMVDQAILIQADYFIGNCLSSFTSFVTRSRLVQEKPTAFWGYDSQ